MFYNNKNVRGTARVANCSMLVKYMGEMCRYVKSGKGVLKEFGAGQVQFTHRDSREF